jgi:hypothetical protein
MRMLLAGIVAALLIGAWLRALRAELRRRRARASEWDAGGGRPDLWTSQARCPSCGGRGGLMETEGDAQWFVCLRCGGRTPRRTRG